MLSDSDKILHAQYLIDKKSIGYKEVFTKENPKVSVVISTYNAGEMLVNYSLKSVLDQTHKNLEIIIVGDGCTDDTEERIKNLNDSRIIFKNLPHNDIAAKNWYSVGVPAINAGLQLCTGQYVCHLDDDDYFFPTRIEKLVNFNKNAKAELIHHPFDIYYPPIETNRILHIPSEICTCGQITTSTLFYHGWFSKVLIGNGDAELKTPGDWDKCRKILEFGGKSAAYPELLLLKNETRACSSNRNRIFRPYPGSPGVTA